MTATLPVGGWGRRSSAPHVESDDRPHLNRLYSIAGLEPRSSPPIVQHRGCPGRGGRCGLRGDGERRHHQSRLPSAAVTTEGLTMLSSSTAQGRLLLFASVMAVLAMATGSALFTTALAVSVSTGWLAAGADRPRYEGPAG